MKKVITIMLIAVMALALASSAFAYSYANGYVSGEYTDCTEADWIETYVDGQAAGGAVLNFAVDPSAESVTVEVYKNFQPAYTEVVTVAGSEPEPTEPPVESTEPEPTEPPVESTEPEPTVKPTEKPVETKAPTNGGTTNKGTGEKANKVGEADYTVVVVCVLLAGATGMVVLGKKRGKQN